MQPTCSITKESDEHAMMYNVEHARSIQQILVGQPSVTEKVMFGGIVFMVKSHIVCGLLGDELLVRVGTERYETALQEAHVRPFQMGKRQSKGWVVVGNQAFSSTDNLNTWVQRGIATVATLPAKH